MGLRAVSTQTLQRLPMYLNYLKALPENKKLNISATMIAEALGLNHVQVRKDLAIISKGGKPKVGYVTDLLIDDIEQYLGYDSANSAVIIGAGNLGHALFAFTGFSEYGLDIVAAFDTDESVVGTTINGKMVLPIDGLSSFCHSENIKIGIITVPAQKAQEVCNMLISSGILAIWNFAPIHLVVPENVLVQNENMACSLAVLSKHLKQKNRE